jgi:two-component system nitrogen regulation sensor histidine kinase GlnL
MPADLRRVLDALLDGVVVVDRDGCVEQLNAEACRILGTSTEAVAGWPVERVAGGAAFSKAVRSALAQGGASVENEVAVPRRFEGDLVVDVAVSPLADEGGRADGAVVLLRDRTIGVALREAESERARSEAFGQMAAGLAHEVKNPLAGIRGAAELLGARAGTERGREVAGLIVREVDRIATLLDDFMMFARPGALRLAPVNLHRVLDDVLDVLATDPLGARAQVERAFDPSIPELLADGDRLVQVFLNLARNALESMEERPGTLHIATWLRLDHRIDLGDGERVPSVAVEVRDTGCGVPEAIRSRIMTPFFTTKPNGTGLGLALSRHYVALHGGALQIESQEGRGTAVRVSLPLRRAP